MLWMPLRTRESCAARKNARSRCSRKGCSTTLLIRAKMVLSEKTKDAANFAKTANSAIPIEKATYLASPYYLCRHCAENPPLPPQALQLLTALAPTNTRTQAQAHTDKTEGHGKGPPPTSPATQHTDTATQMAAPPTAMRALTWPRRPASPAGSGACRWQPPCRPW